MKGELVDHELHYEELPKKGGKKMGFQHLTKKRLTKLGSRVGQGHRKPELIAAWAKEKQLRKEYQAGKSPTTIAIENNINIRSVYRIVRGK
jgi:hypothetical protein